MFRARLRPSRRAVLAGGLAALALPGWAGGARLRVATFNPALSRRGPGLLLRDILSAEDPQVEAAARVVAAARADVVLLTGIDWDHDLHALGAFADRVAAHGLRYGHRFGPRPNTGWQTGLDLVGDGRHNTADDAQGYGAFVGVKGMGLLSRLPIAAQEARDFSDFLWRDLPGALLPQQDGADVYPEAVLAVQRLSTTGHWDVPLVLPNGGRLHVLAWYATPPIFGGPHDRNLRRNHDETRFWSLFLDGALPMAPPGGPFVLMGDANLDPVAGDGLSEAMATLLAHPALQDPAPSSPGARAALGPVPHDLGTVLWDGPRQPGNLRVDYVLPSAGLRVLDSRVLWPAPDDPLAEAVAAASRHRLVWADIALP